MFLLFCMSAFALNAREEGSWVGNWRINLGIYGLVLVLFIFRGSWSMGALVRHVGSDGWHQRPARGLIRH